MQHFRYKAVSDDGRYVRGKMSATNPSELTAMLRESGLEILSYKEEKESSFSLFASVKTKDLITLFIHLEQLERAGVSIIDSISDLRESTDSPKLKNLMHEIHESIKNGSLFSESLAKHPKIFDPVYIGLIAMGEKTGNLADSFKSIIEDIKWSSEIKRKAKKATIGPSFGLILMFVVVGIMTTIVVPKVTGFLAAQEIDLPGTTVALMAFSDFFQNYWFVMLFGGPILWLIIKALTKIPEIRVKVDAFKLKIPIIGPIITKIESAKFCQFFAMTFKSGLGVLECLDSSSQALNNSAIKQSIMYAKQQVSDGQSLNKSINDTQYFPNLVVRMFKVGEESGNMENALLNIRFFYDREINDSIERLVGMIQPSITFVMGGMIGWITIAVFGPIYSTFSNF